MLTDVKFYMLGIFICKRIWWFLRYSKLTVLLSAHVFAGLEHLFSLGVGAWHSSLLLSKIRLCEAQCQELRSQSAVRSKKLTYEMPGKAQVIFVHITVPVQVDRVRVPPTEWIHTGDQVRKVTTCMSQWQTRADTYDGRGISRLVNWCGWQQQRNKAWWLSKSLSNQTLTPVYALSTCYAIWKVIKRKYLPCIWLSFHIVSVQKVHTCQDQELSQMVMTFVSSGDLSKSGWSDSSK